MHNKMVPIVNGVVVWNGFEIIAWGLLILISLISLIFTKLKKKKNP